MAQGEKLKLGVIVGEQKNAAVLTIFLRGKVDMATSSELEEHSTEADM